MPGPFRFLVEAPIFERGAHGRRRIRVEQHLTPGQVEFGDELGGRVHAHRPIEMVMPSPGRGIGRRHLRKIDPWLHVARGHSDPQAVAVAQRKQQRRVEGPGGKRTRLDESGLGATLLGLQLEIGDVPARRRERQRQRDPAVDEDLRTVERQGARAAHHERDDARGGRSVLDLDHHDVTGPADAVHALYCISARHFRPRLRYGRAGDWRLTYRRFAGRHSPPIVGADPPVEGPVITDDRDGAARVDDGPTGTPDGADDHDSRPSSDLAWRSISAGTISAGVRPS